MALCFALTVFYDDSILRLTVNLNVFIMKRDRNR